ncbi:MAG: putative sugar O-methyltransferase [Proteobacteria bacterium]|nr:putative sugar O-methyltransferase [Pseudomonadota bacterium]
MRRLQAKARRLFSVELWGAPSLVHPLFDAPRPRVRRTRAPTPVDPALVSRIADNFRRADADFNTQSPSMWQKIESNNQAFTGALRQGDAPGLQRQFETLFQDELLGGFGHRESLYFGENRWRPGFQELRMTDMLLSLGEALGVLNLPNHVQMNLLDYVDFVHTDQDRLLADIEARLGFSLVMPLVGNPPVFRLNGVSTSADMVRHAYVAFRLRQLGLNPEDPIVEIGGGFGSLALLAHRAGFRNYTIIDLPYVGAIQTFFLGTALGPDAVSGYGEPEKAIRLLPPPAIKDIGNGSVAMVINMDSLPEIGEPEAGAYIREIGRISRLFLSINQEAQAYIPDVGPQLVVPDLVASVDGFRLMHRSRYWMMEGYVEELYRIERSRG